MNHLRYFDVFETALLTLTVVVDEDLAVTEIFSRDASELLSARTGFILRADAITEPRKQLEQYLSGARRQFELALAPKGSTFQHQVWDLLVQIPYGETRSYGQLAHEMGNPNGSRAVGRANATNPIAIVVPCHRVIGSTGALTGYAGGLNVKQTLLELEGVLKPTLFSIDSPN